MATKNQRKKKRKARQEVSHTKKYREIKAQQRENNDREAEWEALGRQVLKFVDERQAGLQSVREEAKDIAKALSMLSSRMKGLAHDAETRLEAFRVEPPTERATAVLIAERDEAEARCLELEEALSEAQERLRARVLIEHKEDTAPPKWLQRAAQDLADRNGIPHWEFYDEVGKRAVRWATDHLRGKGGSDAVPEDQAND
jgi:hypothetical protein